MSELGTAFCQYALAMITVQKTPRVPSDLYELTVAELKRTSEVLAEAFYGAEIDFTEIDREGDE